MHVTFCSAAASSGLRSSPPAAAASLRGDRPVDAGDMQCNGAGLFIFTRILVRACVAMGFAIFGSSHDAVGFPCCFPYVATCRSHILHAVTRPSCISVSSLPIPMRTLPGVAFFVSCCLPFAVHQWSQEIGDLLQTTGGSQEEALRRSHRAGSRPELDLHPVGRRGFGCEERPREGRRFSFEA